MMLPICVIGPVFVDVKGRSSGAYQPEGKNIGDVFITHGGVCRNIAEDFASTGMKVTFVTMTENTAIGSDATDRLKKAGVNLDFAVTSPNGLGMWLAVMDEKGNLRGSISRQPDFAPLEKLLFQQGDEIIAGCSGVVLHFDMTPCITQRVTSLAEKYKKPVYCAVGNQTFLLKHPEYLKKTACCILNRREAARLFDVAEDHITPEYLSSWVKKLELGALVVTMGAEGCLYWDGCAGTCPAENACMADSTGAGDAFFAGTVMGLTKGMALSTAVRAGTALAARVIGSTENVCPRDLSFWQRFI